MKVSWFRYFVCVLATVGVNVPTGMAAPYLVEGALVKIHGKVIDSETKDPVQASITYEKLPYADDMGIARSSSENGTYQMYMLQEGKYSIEVVAQGYAPYSEEITVLDDDGDGVLEKDFELNRGVGVIAPEEPKLEVITLENLLFPRGRADISPSSFPELNTIVDMMSERLTVTIQLEGHTDFQGNAQANLELSQSRVEAVRDYLAKKGVKKKRMLLKAFGGTQPLTRDRTPEAMSKNRRVEVRIIE